MKSAEMRAMRAAALRRLAAQPRGGASRPVVGRRIAPSGEKRAQVGLMPDLLLSALLALALLALALVATNGAVAPTPGIPTLERNVTTPVPPLRPDDSDDLDPRDPQVLCAIFDTHTRCVRVPT